MFHSLRSKFLYVISFFLYIYIDPLGTHVYIVRVDEVQLLSIVLLRGERGFRGRAVLWKRCETLEPRIDLAEIAGDFNSRLSNANP